MDDEKLVEKVATAIYENDREFCKADIVGLDFEVCKDYARAAIAAVRSHDAEQAKSAIDAFMANHDPDDYTHPLSLTVGPRHTRGGLTSG